MDLRTLERHRGSVSTRSGELSYLDVGTGPVALFVHGIGTNAYLWRHVLGACGAQRRCLALDLPLHGRSPAAAQQDFTLGGLADVLEDFRAALGLDEFDLVANDTGGAVAQVFAVRHAERLRTFTLTNCDTHTNLPPEAFRPIVELAERGLLARVSTRLAADLGQARAGVLGLGFERPDLVPDEVLRAYVEPVFGTATAARQFERLVLSLDAADLVAIEPRLKELTVPTLVVWGTDDPNFAVSWAYWLRDTIPGVLEVVEIDGAKLFFPDERPEDLVPHLLRHWARVTGKVG
ncbi:alpha/beta fold hydrolase [Amycolatopsis sp. H20-H5]|uniref:alpha/beta fold hydrolase n=1 Tax=Amycolatopsis sp. H20-H5 TaxID=3046309 RepID=UPI002DB58429|nr:alpha/beta hydrolase [Amycolatopsis sp. H20-H5]MEC3979980.1 alpha/beta hydrolase [Amycolatopsis sp. H20-H5]